MCVRINCHRIVVIGGNVTIKINSLFSAIAFKMTRKGRITETNIECVIKAASQHVIHVEITPYLVYVFFCRNSAILHYFSISL